MSAASMSTNSSADHPRACGANQRKSLGLGRQRGSSPRMRGKRPSPCCGPRPSRIIPAHAGQTSPVASASGAPADHPRACGANVMVPSACMLMVGSSPRMRGKRHPPSPCNPVMRIIPAHAGQTVSNSSRTSARSDHPRACGANPALSVMTAAPAGSSPRMRGKPRLERDDSRTRRIIPAHAGQTSRTPTPTPTVSDHPRACGANAAAGRIRTLRRGSSPRMRGKPHQRVMPPAGRRIIPAHAGQTDLDKFYGDVNADHPRACGANPCRPPIRWMNTGSSPRMRGKLGHRHRRYGRARIIPAHAGQTRC